MGQGKNAFQKSSIPLVGLRIEVGVKMYADGLVIKLFQLGAKARLPIDFFLGKYIIRKTDGLKYTQHALSKIGILRMDDIELFDIRIQYFNNNLCGVVRRDNIESRTLIGRDPYLILGFAIVEKFGKKIKYHILGNEKMWGIANIAT